MIRQSVLILTISCQSLWAGAPQNRISLELEGGLVWDSAQRVVELNDIFTKADDGWVADAKVEATRQAEREPSLTGVYSFSTTDYRRQDTFDWTLQKLFGDFNYDFGPLSGGASHTFSHLQWGAYRLLLKESRIYATRRFAEHWTVLGALDYRFKTVRTLPQYAALGKTVSINLLRAFSDQRGRFAVGLVQARENARSDQLDYTDYRLQASLIRKFQMLDKETELRLSWAFFNREFSAFNSGADIGRSDIYNLAGAEWQIRVNKYLYAIGRVNYSDYRSTFELAEYSETLASLRLRLRFE